MKFEDNPSPYLTFLESAAPSTPASTFGKLYETTDGFLHFKNDAGTDLNVSRPPGYEYDYTEITSPASITATPTSVDTVITGAAVAYDGATIIVVEFFCGRAVSPSANNSLYAYLYDGASAIGNLLNYYSPTAVLDGPVLVRKRLTPTAATHTYSIRANVDSGTGSLTAGAGTTTLLVPAYMRITKA